MQPITYVRRDNLTFDEIIPATELRVRTDEFLSELTGALELGGCELIGHIKGLIDAGDKGHLLFSITSFEDGARFKGDMAGGIIRAEFTINVIVYGIEKRIIEEAFQNIFEKHFG